MKSTTIDGMLCFSPENRKEKKELIQALGFQFDQYNKIYTKNGEPVRCIICKRWITLKTWGQFPPGAMVAVCKKYICNLEYTIEFEDDDKDDSPTPTGIKGHGPEV